MGWHLAIGRPAGESVQSIEVLRAEMLQYTEVLDWLDPHFEPELYKDSYVLPDGVASIVQKPPSDGSLAVPWIHVRLSSEDPSAALEALLDLASGLGMLLYDGDVVVTHDNLEEVIARTYHFGEEDEGEGSTGAARPRETWGPHLARRYKTAEKRKARGSN